VRLRTARRCIRTLRHLVAGINLPTCAAQVRAAQVRAAQVRAAQVRAPQVRAAQVQALVQKSLGEAKSEVES